VADDRKFTPFSSLFRYAGLRLSGKVRFPEERIGEQAETRWGTPRIVKQIVIDAPRSGQEPGAVFMVRFRLAGMSPRANMIFLNLPIPFIAGLPGFRTKLWLYDDATGCFQGLYEWETAEDAKAYAGSFAAGFMKRRSVPGSAEYAIFDRGSGREVAGGAL
jgi:hypothetical protein